MVGGLLCPPCDPKSSAGIIFFDRAGFLGMCGHGTIGLMVTLRHLGRIESGTHQIETPVGRISATLIDDNMVRFTNVPSYRTRKDVVVEVPGFGTVVGDVAWGGNWFFLVNNNREALTLERTDELLRLTKAIRRQLVVDGITGDDNEPIHHIELHGVSDCVGVDSRNFVLCPGGAYDRSPCGTGTSARLACLAADRLIEPGQTWRQESIVGSVFSGSIEMDGNRVIPSISGSAFVHGESQLILDPADPFVHGIGS